MNEKAHIPQIVLDIFKNYFGIDAHHFSVIASASHLLPWEEACCHIDENDVPIIYIKNDTVFSKDMILFHECIHAARAKLRSSIFEEIIAFDITKNFFPQEISSIRTILSPLFTNPYEVLFICSASIIIGCSPLFLPSTPSISFLYGILGFLWAFPFFRLAHRWRLYNKATRNLKKKHPNTFWNVLMQLSDKDIFKIAKHTVKTEQE